MRRRTRGWKNWRGPPGEAEALKNQIAGLQAANDAKEQEHAAELKAARINNAVEVALLSAGAKKTTWL